MIFLIMIYFGCPLKRCSFSFHSCKNTLTDSSTVVEPFLPGSSFSSGEGQGKLSAAAFSSRGCDVHAAVCVGSIQRVQQQHAQYVVQVKNVKVQ